MKRTLLTAVAALSIQMVAAKNFTPSSSPNATGNQLINGPAMSNNSQFNGLNYVEQNNINVYVNQSPQGGYYPGQQIPYQNYLGWCQSHLSTLKMAQSEANLLAQYGDFKAANKQVYSALNAMAQMIKLFPMSPYPHTAIAVVEGAQIARELRSATSQATQSSGQSSPSPYPSNELPPIWWPVPIEPGLPQSTSQHVQYLALSKIIDIVEYAYSLDSHYFTMSYETCSRYGCYQGNYTPNMPESYFDMIIYLADSFLKTYLDAASRLGDDRVELQVARGFVRAAKTTLNTAVHRRALVCQIQDLAQIEQSISIFLGRPNSIPEYMRVQQTRGLVANASREIDQYTCYLGY